MIKLKLFKKYRYTLFNSSEGRRELFSFRNRPSATSWNKALLLLVESGTLSIIMIGKEHRFIFNLRLNSSYKFLTYEYVIKSLFRSLAKETSKKLSASGLRKNIKLNLRPSADEWAKYLEDLVSSGILRQIDDGHASLFTLNSI